ALLGAEENFALAIRDLHSDQLVAVFQSQRNDAALARVTVGRELGFFDQPFLGGHDDEAVLGVFFHRQCRRDFSPPARASKFTKALPFAALLASGISCTLSQ